MSIQQYIFDFIEKSVQTQNMTILYLGLGLLFLLTYFILIWFVFENNKNFAIVISLIPILLLDYFYSLSTGSFTFVLPIINSSYTVHNMILTLNTISWTLGYGLYHSIGAPVFESIQGSVTITLLEKLTIFALVFADSVIEFFVLFFIFYYIADKTGYALIGSFTLISLYSIFISNPLTEYDITQKTVSHIYYFLNVASPEQKITVVGSLILSFLLILFIINFITNIFLSVLKSSVRPSLESKIWEVSVGGEVFLLVLAYSFLLFLKPSFSWYITIPIIIGYNLLRNQMKGYSESRRQHREQVETIREAMNPDDR